MNRTRQKLGRWGENKAAEYLVAQGYTILERNLRTAHGELDLVARKNDLLVFVEVKARSSHAFSYPEEAVTPNKQLHMMSAAEEYLRAHPESGETWQFDVIAIERPRDGTALITHFENVIA